MSIFVLLKNILPGTQLKKNLSSTFSGGNAFYGNYSTSSSTVLTLFRDPAIFVKVKIHKKKNVSAEWYGKYCLEMSKSWLRRQHCLVTKPGMIFLTCLLPGNSAVVKCHYIC